MRLTRQPSLPTSTNFFPSAVGGEGSVLVGSPVMTVFSSGLVRSQMNSLWAVPLKSVLVTNSNLPSSAGATDVTAVGLAAESMVNTYAERNMAHLRDERRRVY